MNNQSPYEGRVGQATGPLSGLCLALTIVIEAIQRQFYIIPKRRAEEFVALFGNPSAN